MLAWTVLRPSRALTPAPAALHCPPTTSAPLWDPSAAPCAQADPGMAVLETADTGTMEGSPWAATAYTQ